MPRFRLDATIGCSATTIVEADTPEAAIEISRSRGAVFWDIRDRHATETAWVIDSADGEAIGIKIDEA